jgi:hypothetical protein
LISIYCHCTLCQRMNGNVFFFFFLISQLIVLYILPFFIFQKGAAFVHGLHFPLISFTWTTPNPSTATTQSHPTPSHPWIIHRCKTCHSYIGATNSKTNVWSLKSAHLKRDPKTNLIRNFERIRPTAHIFYETRMLDVPDGLPKWDGYENLSNRLDLD